MRPRFPLPVRILPDIDRLRPQFQPSEPVAACIAKWRTRFPKRPEIARILQDLSVFVLWLNAEAAQDPNCFLSSDRSGAWVSPIIHRCLQLVSHDEKEAAVPGQALQEVLRHGCILFLQHIRRAFGVMVDGHHFRAKKLKDALRQCTCEWDGMSDLLRWVVISGGLEATNLEDQIWFAAVTAKHTPPKKDPARDPLGLAKNFIWFDGIPGDRLDSFFSRVRDMRATFTEFEGLLHQV